MKDQIELEALIKDRLEEIKTIPARDPLRANRARAKFLANAVSAGNIQRHKGWNSIFRKEQFAMNMLLSLIVLAGLLFGGGEAVKAAQNDLPNEPLYAVKMWSEEVGLQLQNNQEEKVDRLMDMTQTRIQEMMRLAAEDKPIPDSVRQRLEQHLQQALQICSNLDDAALDRTLLRVRDRLQQQDQDMDRLQLHIQTRDTLQLLTQSRTMLRDRLQLVEAGLLNHEMFRNTIRNGFQHGQDDLVTPPAQNQNQQQNGQPTSIPGGAEVTPGGPNGNSGNDSVTPGGPNTDPGGPNTDSGGSNPGSGNNTGSGGNNTSGNGTGGSGTGGNGSGGNRP